MRERVCTPTSAGTLNKKTIRPNAATAWCQTALGRRRMPGNITMPTASHRLRPVIQAHHFAGNQTETTSYQGKSGAGSWADLRANLRF